MIEISDDVIERIEAVLKAVPGGAQKAVSNALNRGLTTVKATAIREVKSTYTVKASAINEYTKIRTKKASSGNMVGEIVYSGQKIPLYKFSVTPKTPGTRRAVHAVIEKGGAGETFRHAFVAKMPNGHVGVFERIGGGGRLPIRELPGLAMPQMTANNDVIKKAEAEAQETIEKRVEHEIFRILNGYGG